MMMARSAVALLLCLALVALFPASGKVKDPYPFKVTVANTKAAVLYEQPAAGYKPYKTVVVPYFPGTSFYITFCGGPNVDRTIKIDKSKITYDQNRGPSGNPMTITYLFGTATLKTSVTWYNSTAVGTPQEDVAKVVTTIELSSTLDRASDYDVQVVNDGNRQAAIGGLKTLIKYLDMFSRPNQLAACMAYIDPSNANPKQPYHPRVKELTTYLTTALNTLKNFRAVR